MKKILYIIYFIILLFFIKLSFSFAINQIFIIRYNKGKYEESIVKGLSNFNIYEKYIAYYNYGNVLYKQGKYEKAIEEYKKVLEMNIPKMKECSVRINYALSMLKEINEEDTSIENREKTLKILKSAKEILCEKGCAHWVDNNGHSEEAERLKAEIERKEMELSINLQGQSSSNVKQDENNMEQDEIERKLKQSQAEAREYRDGKMEKNDKKNPYNGKRW